MRWFLSDLFYDCKVGADDASGEERLHAYSEVKDAEGLDDRLHQSPAESVEDPTGGLTLWHSCADQRQELEAPGQQEEEHEAKCHLERQIKEESGSESDDKRPSSQQAAEPQLMAFETKNDAADDVEEERGFSSIAPHEPQQPDETILNMAQGGKVSTSILPAGGLRLNQSEGLDSQQVSDITCSRSFRTWVGAGFQDAGDPQHDNVLEGDDTEKEDGKGCKLAIMQASTCQEQDPPIPSDFSSSTESTGGQGAELASLEFPRLYQASTLAVLALCSHGLGLTGSYSVKPYVCCMCVCVLPSSASFKSACGIARIASNGLRSLGISKAGTRYGSCLMPGFDNDGAVAFQSRGVLICNQDGYMSENILPMTASQSYPLSGTRPASTRACPVLYGKQIFQSADALNTRVEGEDAEPA